MTWMTTWPGPSGPAYKEHHSEAAAEQHARNIVKSGKAATAVVFEMDEEKSA